VNNIAKWSVSRPVAVTMRIAALVLLGFICLMRLPVDLLPRVDVPTIAVNTNWPNTAPQEMETQITRPIEQAVSTVPGLYNVSSTSSLGSSSVRVQLNYGVDVDQAAVDVLQYVQRARRSFPNDQTLQDPVIFKFDPSTAPILVYGVAGIQDPVKLRTLLQNQISPILESANGVAQVTISGGQERAVIVDVDPKKLQAYGVTLPEVVRRLQAENISLPAGIAQEGNREYTIRTRVYFDSIAEAGALPLGTYNGRLVSLAEVATIRDAAQEQRVFTSLNGEPAVSIAIVKQSEANTVETSKNVIAKLEAVKKSYPDLKFGLVYDQSGFIEGSIHELQETAIIGGVLAILVITFFLRNIRSTLVVALSIPISIISAFSLMYFGGYTLNTISLSALALATGLIVDDAIVVLENIFRHIERDKKRSADAAVSGTQEIMGAVVASTLTVMVVFLPLLLIKGQAGQTFTQFALVVIFAIAVSLFDAVSVVPMLASRFIKEKEIETLEHPELREGKAGFLTRIFDRVGRFFNRMDASYHRGLQWGLKHRWMVIAAAVLATVGVLPLWKYIGTETLPQTDSGDYSVRVRLPIGTALSETREKMAEVEKILLADPDTDTVLLASGANVSTRGIGGGSSYQGGATVHLKANRKTRTEDVIRRVQRQLGQIPGIRANASPFDLVSNILGGQNQGIQVDVFGQELPQIQQAAQVVQEAIRGVAGLEGVDLSVEEATPELQWKVDRQKAAALGVTSQDIADAIGASTSGRLATYFQEGGFQYPIYVQLPVTERRTVQELLRLPIRPSGTTTAGQAPRPQVLLSQVATPVETVGPNEITRLNRQRYLSVGGRVVDRAESDVQADVAAALRNVEMPEGTYWDFGDRQKRRAEEFSGLGLAVFLALALIYMLLATQFESFIYPLIVLCSVPLCISGVIIAMFLSDRAFGLTAWVGLLMLIGIVVKNGILLVDYTNQLRSRGIGRDEAVLIASPTRLRPILMTSLCAILGMLPLALGLGASSEIQAPLATAVVGGLTTSTILTLFVVPVVYTFFDDLARRFRKDPRDLAHSDLIEPSVAASGGSPDPEPVLPGFERGDGRD